MLSDNLFKGLMPIVLHHVILRLHTMPPERGGLAFLAQWHQASGGLVASVATVSNPKWIFCMFCLQALLPEALVPLTLLRHEPGCRVLLCGDPK